MPKYTKWEESFIRSKYPVMTSTEIGKILGRSPNAIRAKALRIMRLTPEQVRRKKINGGKKGSRTGIKTPPDNSKPNGYISFRARQWMIKVDGNWKAYNRYLWEQKNGKIPEGMVIALIDRTADKFDVGNMRLTTRRVLGKETLDPDKLNASKKRKKEYKNLMKLYGVRQNKIP